MELSGERGKGPVVVEEVEGVVEDAGEEDTGDGRSEVGEDEDIVR